MLCLTVWHIHMRSMCSNGLNLIVTLMALASIEPTQLTESKRDCSWHSICEKTKAINKSDLL